MVSEIFDSFLLPFFLSLLCCCAITIILWPFITDVEKEVCRLASSSMAGEREFLTEFDYELSEEKWKYFTSTKNFTLNES